MSDDTTKFADVLRFLNQAESSEDLAKAIQVPGNPEAGNKIAQAIIAKRAAVGGMLVAHEDVASIPSVGEEGLALIAAAAGKISVGADNVEAERSRFHALILQNPNFFGNIENSPFKAVKKQQGDISYEELVCVGLNPPFDRLEGVIRIKKTVGYSGDICTPGSTEYVRFYVDLHNNGIFNDVGLASVGVHDIPGSKPLCYAVRLDFSSIKKFCTIENIVKVRAILSWNVPPPANAPNFIPVWGNRLDVEVQIEPAHFFLFGDLVKEIDVAKISIPDPIGPVIHSLDPATKLVAAAPQPISLAQKKEIYKGKDIPVHRFAFSQAFPLLLEKAAVPDVFLAGNQSALQSLGLTSDEVTSLVDKLQLTTNGDTSFEELECVGLRPSRDVLEGVLTIKKQNGYSGSLCGNGSTEYVAFWMNFGDGAGFRYVGTATVTVHDLKNIPGQGLQYAVALKTDLSKWRVPCEVGPRVTLLRAILSWEAAPPQNDPNYVPVWGNRVECRVQLRPGQGVGHVPLFLTVGDVPTNRIDQGTGLATGAMEIASTVILNQSPFGGSITITGEIGNPPDVFAGKLPFKYKIEVSRDGVNDFHPLTNTITVSTSEMINGNPIFCGLFQTVCDATLTAVDDGDGLGDGWYTYLENPTGVHTRTLIDEILGFWGTDTSMEGMWKIRLTFKDPNTIDINTNKPKLYPGFAEVKVWIDDTAPTAQVDITGAVFNGKPIQAVDCGKFPIGTQLSGTYSAHDAGSLPNQNDPAYQHFGGLTFTVLPTGPANGAAVVPQSRAFPVVPTIGEDGTWTLDTSKMQACGYVIELAVCDRTNYNSRGNGLLCVRAEVGFCLETPLLIG